MSRTYGAAARPPAAVAATGGLPAKYAPIVAGYAKGPFLEPETVTPTQWRWRNARTYIIRNKVDGLDYRAVRVTSSEGGKFVGYWAVELLGEPATLGADYDEDVEAAISRHQAKLKESHYG